MPTAPVGVRGDAPRPNNATTCARRLDAVGCDAGEPARRTRRPRVSRDTQRATKPGERRAAQIWYTRPRAPARGTAQARLRKWFVAGGHRLPARSRRVGLPNRGRGGPSPQRGSQLTLRCVAAHTPNGLAAKAVLGPIHARRAEGSRSAAMHQRSAAPCEHPPWEAPRRSGRATAAARRWHATPNRRAREARAGTRGSVDWERGRARSITCETIWLIVSSAAVPVRVRAEEARAV